MAEKDEREVLLRVKHLKQYFKFGTGEYKYNKAVHDVSFDIHRGEVFGLVGESGCGKTTTGRSIIKLYDITSGDVYFKGVRVSAGTRWNEKEIKYTLIRMRDEVERLNSERNIKIAELDNKQLDGDIDFKPVDLVTVQEEIVAEKHETKSKINSIKDEREEEIKDVRTACGDDTALFEDKRSELVLKFNAKIDLLKIESNKRLEALKKRESELLEAKKAHDEFKKHIISEINKDYDEKIAKVKSDAQVIVNREKANIKQAHYDTAHCDDTYRKEEIAKVNNEYTPLLEKATQELEAFEDKKSEEYLKSYEDYKHLYKEYRTKLKLAKKARLMTQIQMIFQDPIASLDPRMTVKEIIAEGFRIRGIRDNKFINKKVEEVLRLVGLVPEHATRYPHEFSGGQRQRIGIARAMVMDPELIIADEPVSALDVSIQAQVINLLSDLKNNLGLTILFIAHDLSVVKYFCDRIGVMYFGQMVELATSEELFKHPLHPYTKSLLSAIPHPDPNFEKNRVKINYNPNIAHDYSKQKPSLREVNPGHFILCNDEEFARYKKEVKEK